jgi:hypothetical protein
MPAKEIAIQWQGRTQDVEEIQHLLQAFQPVVTRSTEMNLLGIMFEGAQKPIILNLGDWAVLNEFDQFQIRVEKKNAIQT